MATDIKTHTTIDANDLLAAVARQRDSYANLVAQLEAVIVAKDREIEALKAAKSAKVA